MQDLALRFGALLAIFAALAHSAIGERAVFPRLRIEPARLAPLFRAIWHCLSLVWLSGAALLLCLPRAETGEARRLTLLMIAAIYGSAALCNAIGTKGRHFGWMVLAAVCLLVMLGR